MSEPVREEPRRPRTPLRARPVECLAGVEPLVGDAGVVGGASGGGDTGTITFYVKTPVGFDQLELQDACCDAVAEATAKGYLRQNSVDSVTGRNTGNNLGAGSPVFRR